MVSAWFPAPNIDQLKRTATVGLCILHSTCSIFILQCGLSFKLNRNLFTKIRFHSASSKRFTSFSYALTICDPSRTQMIYWASTKDFKGPHNKKVLKRWDCRTSEPGWDLLSRFRWKKMLFSDWKLFSVHVSKLVKHYFKISFKMWFKILFNKFFVWWHVISSQLY